VSRKGDIRSLRRHDPDQVQRVTALATASWWSPVGISAS